MEFGEAGREDSWQEKMKRHPFWKSQKTLKSMTDFNYALRKISHPHEHRPLPSPHVFLLPATSRWKPSGTKSWQTRQQTKIIANTCQATIAKPSLPCSQGLLKQLYMVSHSKLNQDMKIEPYMFYVVATSEEEHCLFLEAERPAFQNTELFLPQGAVSDLCLRLCSSGFAQSQDWQHQTPRKLVLGTTLLLNQKLWGQGPTFFNPSSPWNWSLITGLHSPYPKCWCWISKYQRRRGWKHWCKAAVHIFNRILLSHKKECNLTICHNLMTQSVSC